MDNQPQLFDFQLELDALGAVMYRPDVFENMIEHLSPRDFGDPLLGAIFERMGDMRAQNLEINPATVYRRCADMAPQLEPLGGAGLFAKLGGIGVGASGAASTTARLIADLARRRRAVEAAEATISKIRSHQISTAEAAAAELEAALDALSPEDGASSPSTAADCMAMVVRETLEAQSGKSPGILLKHLPEVSEILGPMMPTEFTVLAGRPAMGKTGVAMKIATSAARQGEGVLYLSQEMRKPEIMMRAASDLLYKGEHTDIPFHKFIKMALSANDIRRVEKLGEVMADWPLIIDDRAGHTLATIGAAGRKAARQFERQGKKLKILIVDHLQLMGSDERGSNDYSKATANSRGLKRLAKQLNCHIVALSQMSRKCEEREDKRPQMSDLRDTGAIEEDANNVLMLYRHEYYLKKMKVPGMADPNLDAEIEQWAGVLELLGRKVRNGGEAERRVNYMTAYQAFRSFPKDGEYLANEA